MKENARPSSAIDMQVHIVGARYYFDDEAQMKNYLEAATTLSFVMVREPNNPVDRQAVAVYAVSHDRLRPVGHISREDLPKVHRMMDAGGAPPATALRVLGLQPARHTTLVAYPVRQDGTMVRDWCAATKNDAKPAATTAAPTVKGSVAAFARFRKTHPQSRWSDLFFLLKQQGLIAKKMSAREFGQMVQKCGGPSGETVRKSGNYAPTRAEELRRCSYIISLAPLLY